MTPSPPPTERLGARLQDSFGLLLVTLTASFLVTGIEGGRAIAMVAGLLNVCSLLIGFWCTDLNVRSPFSLGLLGLGAAGAATVFVVPVGSFASALGATAHVVLLTVLTVAIVARVARHRDVTAQTIMGAVAAYFLIGQAFAWIYLSLPGYTGETVLDPPASGELPTYFSYVVLSTVGFGDITPATPFAQRVTVLEALLAQIFLSVLVARLVSLYSSNR